MGIAIAADEESPAGRFSMCLLVGENGCCYLRVVSSLMPSSVSSGVSSAGRFRRPSFSHSSTNSLKRDGELVDSGMTTKAAPDTIREILRLMQGFGGSL